MKDKITLCPVQADDLEFVAGVFAATRADRFAGAALAPQQLQQLLTQQFGAQQAQYRAQFPQAELSLVLSNDVPIGYFHVDRSGKRYVLVDVALVPKRSGRGVGTQLIGALIDEAFAEGKVVCAHVEKNNQGAWRLYRRLGFRVVDDNGVYLEIECGPTIQNPPDNPTGP